MQNDLWDKKRENLQQQLTEDVLDLFSHMGMGSAMPGACKIPIPNTDPQVFIIVGDIRRIKNLILDED